MVNECRIFAPPPKNRLVYDLNRIFFFYFLSYFISVSQEQFLVHVFKIFISQDLPCQVGQFSFHWGPSVNSKASPFVNSRIPKQECAQNSFEGFSGPPHTAGFVWWTRLLLWLGSGPLPHHSSSLNTTYPTAQCLPTTMAPMGIPCSILYGVPYSSRLSGMDVLSPSRAMSVHSSLTLARL